MSLTVDLLRERLFDKADARGADVAGLVGDQLNTMNALLESSVNALTGDERVKAHLEAQFKLGKFSAEAAAFVEAHIWWESFRETLLDVAQMATEVAIEVVAKGLAEAMKGGFRG